MVEVYVGRRDLLVSGPCASQVSITINSFGSIDRVTVASVAK